MSALKSLLNSPNRPSANDSPNRPQPRLLPPLPLMPSSPTSPRNLPHALHIPRIPNTSHPLRPKPKVIKDAPVFTRSATRGPLRYPPHVYPLDQPASTSSTTDPTPGTKTTTKPPKRTRSSTSLSCSRSRTCTSTSSPQTAPPTLASYHTSFSLFPPQAEIGLYPRHIPYNSEKQVYLSATGRDFFEVYQYTFRIPGDCGSAVRRGGKNAVGTDDEGTGTGTGTTGDEEESGFHKGPVQQGGEGKTYTMLWDYNTGLVRTTPLFKCCGYGKTTPAKMLNKNIGLKEICHSITGGALVAQGYWIPYLAAKHIAATFCYSIRHALTPVFGLDFIELCLPPTSSQFGCMLIDPEVTAQCRADAIAFRDYELANPTERPAGGAGGGSRRQGSPRTPSPGESRAGSPVAGMRLPMPANAGSRLRVGVVSSGSSSAGEGSEVGEDDVYLLSPTAAAAHGVDSASGSPVFRNVWTHANVPRSAPRMGIEDELHSPKSVMKAFGRNHAKAKRMFRDFDEEEYGVGLGSGSAYSSPGQSPKRGKVAVGGGRGWEVRMVGMGDGEVDGGYEADADEMDIDVQEGLGGGRKVKKGECFNEFDAARVLLNLGVRVKREAGRRASA